MQTTKVQTTTDEAMLDQLRAILLQEDRPIVRHLENVLDDPELLAERMLPIMERRLAIMRQNFPKEYQLVVDRLIEERIKNSQEQIVEVIYPVLGSMVRKYIEHQFQLLKESIEARIAEMRERLNFWKRLKARFSGVSEAEVLLAAMDVPEVEEIFLVERHSGLLLAHAARRQNLDRDVIAGMLTAIKAFVEDAFQRENEELDYIAYAHYKIIVENYSSYYIAALTTGSTSALERDLLARKLHDFILKEYSRFENGGEKPDYERASGLLEERFFK